jgi:hypothetical protein
MRNLFPVMSGHHYGEAERLIGAVTHHGNLEPGDHGDVLALAQVHATLAQSDLREARALIARIHLAATVATAERLSTGSQWEEGYRKFAEQVLTIIRRGEDPDA